ncbi:phage tail protein, partial [Klebsiella sp. KE9038]
MTQHLIKGRKGGSSSPRTPTEQPDDLQSVAKAKILIALGEGEFAGALTAKDIYLDGTPLENSDGSQNFSGVAWEFRPGTQAQSYIQGIPGSENEINVGVEVSSKTAWSRSFSNTQLSAVRLRIKWPSLLKQEDDGDLVGNAVSYAVDLQTDGGSWQTMLESAVSGKTTSGYERCHRIDLPRATTGWVLRLRKVTEDANTSKTGDAMMLQSYAEVLDAKLRYPNTALLYVEFDSRQFNGSIPKISCSPRGRVIRVPDNYDPETRQYSGIWTGAFKWAWTDNPAWIFYDLIVSDRFGLGNRLTSQNIDKWTLYQVARYCDEPVPDGKGGEGTEPRYLCNVYVQDRNDAYTVLRDFAAIFRGMTCWSGDQVIALADMPRDIDYTYTRANVINGRFHYASSSSKTRYTNALVSWSDPDNEYADAMEPVFEQPLVARYGFNQLELTAIGCTRQSEANRKGRWGILTNNKDRVVTFSVGLDGNIPQPGYVIAVADEMLAGKANGGRTSKVDGRVITLDRKTEAKAGDRLLLNLPSGVTQGRTIESIDGHVVTVTAEYAERPETECVWAIESDSLRVQQYRVVSVKDNNDSTFTISAAAHDPDKYARIDTGAIIDSRPISVIPPGKQSAPANIVVESYSVVNQGISVETLQVHWAAVKNAIAYEAQWRRNEGNWINVPRSSVASFDVGGIYAGRYTVRVRAINAAEVSSGWAYSEEKTLTGKTGLPSAPVSLTTTSLLHGVQLNWAFPEGSGDTQKTELQYSPNPTGNGAMALSDVTYPGKSYQQMGLQIASTFWYRARIVDRLGNESPWTVWVQGMASDDVGEYYDKLTDAIKGTEAWQEAQRDMEETHKTLTDTADAIREEVAQQVTDINQSISDTAGGIRKQVDGQIATVNKSMTENIDLVNQTLTDAISTANKSINDAVSDLTASVDQQIADVNKTLVAGDTALKSQLQTAENSLKQSIAQTNSGWDKAVRQEVADRIADVNAKAAQAADQLLNEKNEWVAAIESTQQIIQDINNSLATQMAQISAGTGEQFDSQAIWYFDNDREGWTSNGGIPSVIENGWLRPTNHATDAYITSPVISISGKAYRFLKLRLKKTGTPVWSGQVRWRYEGQTFNDSRMLTVAEPDYDGSGRAVLSIQDIPWGSADGKPVIQFRLDLTLDQSDENFIIIDWIAVGRPTPGASTAALREEATTRANADAVEASKRAMLAAQIRGTSESNDLADLSSGLLFQEMNARITADKAEVTARESLQTQFNDNKSSVADELSSLTTLQSSQASKISGLETSLGKKADATALQTLTQKVEQQGTTLTSQGNSLTSLSNRVGRTESGVAANSNAITGLQSTVSQQDGKLTSQGLSLTKLTNDLSATNANVNKKADASALQTLQNTITQQGGTLTSQGSAIVSLENSLNALDVGGANQIPDSGSLARYGNVSTDKYNGNGVMAFTLKAGAAYRDLISINLSAPVDGTEYVLSFYAKAAVNGQKVRSHFYSPNSTKRAVSSQGNIFTNPDGLCDFTLTTEWQRYWVKWTQSAGTGSKKLIVARIQQGLTDQTVYLSSPKFERGNVPTAWSEAPE